jgi:hypothetical protein
MTQRSFQIKLFQNPPCYLEKLNNLSLNIDSYPLISSCLMTFAVELSRHLLEGSVSLSTKERIPNSQFNSNFPYNWPKSTRVNLGQLSSRSNEDFARHHSQGVLSLANNLDQLLDWRWKSLAQTLISKSNSPNYVVSQTVQWSYEPSAS